MDEQVDEVLRVVVPVSLHRFLHRRRTRAEAVRAGFVAVRVPTADSPSLGHVVQSLGLPLTEVESLRLGSDACPPGVSAPRTGVVEVTERVRPQAAPTDPPRFVLDVHLGSLARRMRLLGLDVAYPAHASDDDLIACSLTEGRVLLTRDHGLLRRRKARWAAYVCGDRTDEQLADVLDRFAPRLRPWTRCLICNGRLRPVPARDVVTDVEPGTARNYTEFARCGSCGRVYWRGAHARRLEAVVNSALSPVRGAGNQVETPMPPPAVGS